MATQTNANADFHDNSLDGVIYDFFTLKFDRNYTSTSLLNIENLSINLDAFNLFANEYNEVSKKFVTEPKTILPVTHLGVFTDVLKAGNPTLDLSDNAIKTVTTTLGTGEPPLVPESEIPRPVEDPTLTIRAQQKDAKEKAYDEYQTALNKLNATARKLLLKELGSDAAGITIDDDSGEIKVPDGEDEAMASNTMLEDTYMQYKLGTLHNSLKSVLIACDAN